MTDSGNTGKSKRGVESGGKDEGRDPRSADSEDRRDRAKSTEPEWAASLKQLYNSVVEEPLPDSFRDLLAKLDSGKK